MKINKRFNVIGMIGDCRELIAVPRAEQNHSYHVRERIGEEITEVAIRYDRDTAIDVAAERSAKNPDAIVTVHRKNIFREIA